MGNLPYSMTSAELGEIFGEAGVVKSAMVCFWVIPSELCFKNKVFFRVVSRIRFCFWLSLVEVFESWSGH